MVLLKDENDLSKVSIDGPLPATLANNEDRAAKLLRDQKKLYALVEYSKTDDPRAYIHDYFSAATESLQ